jgi:hypothetical protein
MTVLGPFRYAAENRAGLFTPLGAALVLIAVNQLLQLGFGFGAASLLFADGDEATRIDMKSALVGILPASLLTAALAVWFSRVSGGSPREVLALRGPNLKLWQWFAVIIGFLLVMYVAITAVVVLLGLDPNQYTPGPDGQSPESGSAGVVKETMYDIANEPWLFWMVLPSVVIGAPLAEEFIFRGHVFAALAQSKAGPVGAVLVTSAVWAILHATEPWLSIGMIFVMGLALGWLLLRFGSIWVTVVCHGVWNAFFALLTFGTAPA